MTAPPEGVRRARSRPAGAGRARAGGACAALLLLGAAPAAPAAADEAMGRRLAALRAVVDPAAARALPPAVPAAAAAEAWSCPAWWELSAYAQRARTEAAIRDASLRYAIPPDLLRSVIRAESAFDPRAVSSAGAMGLMQLIPATAAELGVSCPFDPRENVLGGARYLRAQRDRFGAWEPALAAYNAGPARVVAGRIPRETRRYVRQVLAGWRR